MVSTFSGILMDVMAQLTNAFCPMVTTDAGIVMEFKLEQASNALCPILLSSEPAANVTVVVNAHALNALSPIEVTVAGILMEVKTLHW